MAEVRGADPGLECEVCVREVLRAESSLWERLVGKQEVAATVLFVSSTNLQTDETDAEISDYKILYKFTRFN